MQNIRHEVRKSLFPKVKNYDRKTNIEYNEVKIPSRDNHSDILMGSRAVDSYLRGIGGRFSAFLGWGGE